MMKWIQSTGGPLLLMADALLPSWRGTEQDYARACGIDDWLGVLSVGSGNALVLGDEPMQTTAWQEDNRCLLVRWSYAQDESIVVKHLMTADQLEFSGPGTMIDFGSRSVTLFDSSAAGSDLHDEETLRIKLPAQTCEISTLNWKPDQHTRLILHLMSA